MEELGDSMQQLQEMWLLLFTALFMGQLKVYYIRKAENKMKQR